MHVVCSHNHYSFFMFYIILSFSFCVFFSRMKDRKKEEKRKKETNKENKVNHALNFHNYVNLFGPIIFPPD